MISLEDDIAQSMERAMIFAAFMDKLGDCAPRTVAGQQSPSPVARSRPSRVTINYRKNTREAGGANNAPASNS